MYTSKQLVKLTAPLFGEQFLVVFVGIADTFMVAHAGEAAVSGVALVDSISYLIIVVFGALCAGGSILASQYAGSGNKNMVAMSARLLMASVTVIGLVLMLSTLLVGTPVLRLIFGSTEQSVMQSASDYFFYIGISFPMLALYSAAAALFRSQGNSNVTLLASIVMNVVNLAGNAWLIYGCNMGAKGAAISTMLARGSAALLLCVLIYKSGMLRFVTEHKQTVAEYRTLLYKILYIGVPSGVESGLFSFGKLLVQRLYASLGTAALAANAAAGSLSCIATLPGSAISLAMLPVVGQLVGAGQPKEARKLANKLLIAAYVSMLVSNLLVYIFLPQLSGMYGLSAQTTQITRGLLFWHCIFATLFYPAGFCTPAALRAAGDVRFTMTASIVSMIVFRVALSYIFVNVMHLGVISLWAAVFVDWGVRSLLFTLRLNTDKWYKHKMV